ncbi:MAG: aminopeptidase P family protein [Bacteroidaceae bacterium]|nr:aminopeptidase P family protein [Bacteroidaceae bacterium]
MANQTITNRVEALRTWMRSHGLTAFIFPSTDPHCGEYVPDHWKSREWISGFNGSAGTAVVTLSKAAIWTDSRYWLAAEEQLEGTPFQVVRCSRNVATAEELVQWIIQAENKAGFEVGIDAWVNTVTSVRTLKSELIRQGLSLDTSHDPVRELWNNRPTLPLNEVEIQPLCYAGRTAQDKLADIRAYMRQQDVDSLLVSQLDEVAWTLNLRGSDVHCTPLFVAYLVINTDDAELYINPQKVNAQVGAYLKEIGVEVKPYDSARVNKTIRMQFDPDSTNAGIIDQMVHSQIYDPAVNLRLISNKSPIQLMMVHKNATEISGYHNAMLKDGVAMVQFMRWLDDAMQRGERITELTVCDKLRELRSQQPLFRDISFDTIAGYGPHGAIVHYEPTPETDVALEPKGLLLLDSGAQYQDGTTDITRTIPLGPLTENERRDYTLVLKGHIRLAMARFPAGTTGTQLDVLARYAMWQNGLNYGHGTGHGVGSYLSVHEGPHQFRMNWMPTPLQAGMTITIEPGIYIAGSHGVRHENTMVIVADGENEYGQWLRMEPLTLCPFCTTPIVWELMQPDEIEYLNNYHNRVREKLLPLLTDERDREWLIEQTSYLS